MYKWRQTSQSSQAFAKMLSLYSLSLPFRFLGVILSSPAPSPVQCPAAMLTLVSVGVGSGGKAKHVTVWKQLWISCRADSQPAQQALQKRCKYPLTFLSDKGCIWQDAVKSRFCHVTGKQRYNIRGFLRRGFRSNLLFPDRFIMKKKVRTVMLCFSFQYLNLEASRWV